jgi:pyrimidine operon attenuation protein / uracil phosphoribosyltransferase
LQIADLKIKFAIYNLKFEILLTHYQSPVTLMTSQIVEILSTEELRRTVTRMTSQVVERSRDLSKLVLLGIYTRGVSLAHLMARQIELLEQVQVPVGAIDITFYRDDLDQIGVRTPAKTEIPFDLSGTTVVLVDDVIYKGRTVRAALNAVHEYGRPEAIWLAVLVDRGHRELPIHPDFIGRNLPTAKEEQVKVYLQDIDGRDAVELIKP